MKAARYLILKAVCLAILLLWTPLLQANAGTLVLPTYPFVANTILHATDLNGNFAAILGTVNGGISDVNISNSAAINPSKLDHTKTFGTYLLAAATQVLGGGNTGDTNPRFYFDSNGLLGFGSGSAPADITLSRTTTKTLGLTATGGATLDLGNSGKLQIRNAAGSACTFSVPSLTGNRAISITDPGGSASLSFGPAGGLTTNALTFFDGALEQSLSSGLVGQALEGGGPGALPVWTTLNGQNPNQHQAAIQSNPTTPGAIAAGDTVNVVANNTPASTFALVSGPSGFNQGAVNIQTSNVSNNVAEVAGTAQTGPLATMWVTAKPGQTTSERIWIGLFTTDPSGTDTPASCSGLRFSTNAGDTHWMLYNHDGAASTVVDTGITPGTTNLSSFILDATAGTSMVVTINGAAPVSNASHMPSTFNKFPAVILTTLTTSVETMTFGRMSVQSN